MAMKISRRTVLASTAGLVTLSLAACSSVDETTEMDPAVLGRPILRFDDAIAMAKGDDSFITHLTGDKLKFFDAMYFVNKSPYGVYAQTLKILEPDELGEANTTWRVTQTFDVSTGREAEERYFTTTPRGIFTFDPHRRYRDYQSRQWDGAEMPFAMFWDYIYPNGRPTGIAFHAATGVNEHYVGIRASGGCIRTTMEDSERLFNMVGDRRGAIPDFKDMDPTAVLQVDDEGDVLMKDAFKILIVVEENDNIDWQPFVRDEVWQRRLDNKKTFRLNPSLYELVEGGQN